MNSFLSVLEPLQSPHDPLLGALLQARQACMAIGRYTHEYELVRSPPSSSLNRLLGCRWMVSLVSAVFCHSSFGENQIDQDSKNTLFALKVFFWGGGGFRATDSGQTSLATRRIGITATERFWAQYVLETLLFPASTDQRFDYEWLCKVALGLQGGLFLF